MFTVQGSFTVRRRKDGVNGANGLNAVVARLSSPSVVVQSSSSGVVSTYTGTGTSLWVKEGNTPLLLMGGSTLAPGEYTLSLAGTGITPGSFYPADENSMEETVITDHSTMTADKASVVITIIGKRVDGSNFSIVITQSLGKAKAGVNGIHAINGMLNNESLTLPASSSGVITSFALATGLFKVYYGATDVTNDATFAVASQSDCTGTISDTAGTKGVYSITDMPTNKTLGRLTITATYLGVTITKIFKLSKALAGNLGVDATSYSIFLSAYVLVKSPVNAFTPGNVTFTFYKTIGASKDAYSAWYKIYYTTNGSTWTLLSDGGEISEYAVTITPGVTYKGIKCEMYRDEWQVHKVDEQTVLIVCDGSDGKSVNMKPFVLLVSDLPTTGNTDNDGRIVTTDPPYSGHLFMWNAATSTWSDCGLIQGPQGIQGPIGPGGNSLYTWLKYAYTTTPAAEGMYETPGDRNYIGLAYNKASINESTVYTDYQWSLIRGENGLDAVTIEIDRINTVVDANVNAFDLTVSIKVKSGNNYLTAGTDWNFTHNNTGLTDDGDHAGGSLALVMNFTGFTTSSVKVGYCDITITVGSVTFERRITISRSALQGCLVRTSEWTTGVNYRNDSEEVVFPRYLDVVVITAGVNQYLYQCLVSHTAGTFATDLAAGKWLAINGMQPIFTPMLLAINAVIKFMQGQQLLIMSGQDVQAGISGQVTEGTDIRFFAGNANPALAPFSVDEFGNIKSTAGTIGGFVIGENRIGVTGNENGPAFTTEGVGFQDIGANHKNIASFGKIGHSLIRSPDVRYPNALLRLEHEDYVYTEGQTGLALFTRYRPAQNGGNNVMAHSWVNDGNVFSKGGHKIFDDTYIGIAEEQSISLNILTTTQFLFTSNPTANRPVYLPTAAQILYGEVTETSFDSSTGFTFLLHVTAAVGVTNAFRITSVTNGQIVDNNGGNVAYIGMAKGDTLVLRYYNGIYYQVSKLA